MSDPNTQIQQIEQKLKDQIQKQATAQVVSIVIGVILIAVLLGYFGIVSSIVRKALKPKDISMMVIDQAQSSVVGLSKTADTFIQKDAPVMIGNMINDALKNKLPEGRATLEKELKKSATDNLQKYEDILYKSVDESIIKYGDNLRTFAQELQTEQGTKDFENALYDVISESLADEQIAMEMDYYHEALRGLDETVAKLSSGTTENLSEEEIALSRLVAVVRELTSRSELNTVDPTEVLNVGEEK